MELSDSVVMQILTGLVFFLSVLCLVLTILVFCLHRNVKLISKILEDLTSEETKDLNDPKQYRWKRADWKKIR